ncbi:C-C motif chemokine 23 [Ictalurus furcatus]|uniref:C-C motif chemokine 23 n=1 Tax=Ictalurus furcatus TaxID=66913 RepID=UPI0023501F7E|nr:C-C motif chemokine 23 [Ictalurus furcatus]
MFFRCLLLVLVCLQDFTTAVRCVHGPEHCCFKFHRNPISVRLITEYKVTHMDCPNPGIIFTLKNDHRVCADPGVEWVKQAMERFHQCLFESVHGPEHCCFKFHRNPISVRLITEYKVTHMDCPNPGIIFTLKNGRHVCADPGVEWVKQAINFFTSVCLKKTINRGKILSST